MQDELFPKFDDFEEIVAYLEDETNLKKDLLLDITNLDTNWLEQPQIAFSWNQLYNAAQFTLRKMENKHKTLSAETYLQIKQKAVRENEKTTEALLNNRVSTDPIIKKLQEEIFDAQYIVDILSSIKKSMDDRRRALEGLTELFVTHYFVSERDNQALKELGGEKVEEEQTQALNQSEKLKTLLKNRRK